MMMNSSRIKKMVCQVVKIPGKQVSWVHDKSKATEKHLLITDADQPISDSQIKTKKNENRRPNVPKGFMVVYVGEDHRRYVVPTKILSVPDFKVLMDRAAEEYGYEQQGGLTIPCDEDDFQRLLAACKFHSKSKCKSSSCSRTHHHYNTTPIPA